ncbi:MAG: TSUP family transporter [Proteobacteria bacterium]|nr:TSUP family transporter [Pseudomonadota bacterium]MBU0968473.1 TSUP family transporter [Pseudomonadota bacterium]
MPEYIVISLVAVTVAGLTFFSGFGLGTLLMPVFSVFFPIKIAIAATAAIHLANNIFKVLLVGRHANLKIVLLFALPGAVAAVFGAMLLNYFSALPPLASYGLWGREHVITMEKSIIAALIMVFAAIELTPSFKNLSFDLKLIPVGGLLSGFFGGLSGHQGALRTAFLLRAGLDKNCLIGTMVISAVVVDISRLVIYGATFFRQDFTVLQDKGVIGLIAAGSLSAFIGSFAGARLLKKITLAGLQKMIAVMLFGLALALGCGMI